MLDHIIAFTQRYNAKAIYLRLRVSNIADINTTYGYETGDLLLKSVAKRLEEMTLAPDMLARISGASFGLGFYNTDADADEAESLAARFYEALTDKPYASQHGPLSSMQKLVICIIMNAYYACEAMRVKSFLRGRL